MGRKQLVGPPKLGGKGYVEAHSKAYCESSIQYLGTISLWS